MLWAGIIAGGTGLLLSLRYRVGAVAVAGLFGVVLLLIASQFTDWTAGATLANLFVMLCALNAGYVTGFALSCAWARLVAKEQDAAYGAHPVASPNRRGIAMPDLHR